MTAQVHQLSATDAPPPGPGSETESETPGPDTPQPTLEQLIQHSRVLVTEGVDQVRGFGDLAFMELELALASSKWWLLAMLLMCASSLLCFTFLVAALVVFLLESAAPASVLLVCAGVNAVVAFAMFFWVKSLSGKMTFRNLRQQLHKG